MSPEKHLHKIRLHIERKFGSELKSYTLKNIEIVDEDEKVFTVSVLRFQQNFPYKLPIRNLPYADLFVDPHTNVLKVAFFGEHVFVSEIDTSRPIAEMEALFASLIYGSQQEKDGIVLPMRQYYIH